MKRVFASLDKIGLDRLLIVPKALVLIVLFTRVKGGNSLS